MIFYFSSTGNSQYAAEKLAAATGDTVVPIARAYKNGAFIHDVTGHARIGFVAPVFAGTLPCVVAQFIENMTLTGAESCEYVYGVFTCGESSGNESAALRTLLQRKGLRYDGSFDIVMPDNFIIWSSLPPQNEIDAQLDEADAVLDHIIKSVLSREPGDLGTGQPPMLFMPLSPVSTAAGTGKLFADDRCTACGLCAELCPASCIAIDGDRPVWEGECSMCLTCLHRCPAAAIEHGNDTKGKQRYINPRVQ